MKFMTQNIQFVNQTYFRFLTVTKKGGIYRDMHNILRASFVCLCKSMYKLFVNCIYKISSTVAPTKMNNFCIVNEDRNLLIL